MKNSPLWWEDDCHPVPCEVGLLPGEIECVVVGAGLTGLTAALTLARRGMSVLVCDAQNPGQGASSRNGGMIGGGLRLSLDRLIARYGPDLSTRLLSELHIESTEFALRLMKRVKIECNFQLTGRLNVFWRSAEYDPMMRNLEQLQSMVPVSATPVARQDLHHEINSSAYRGAILYDLHGGLNPAKWVAGIRNAALRAGAQVQSQCLVQHVERAGSGFRLHTCRGNVRAGVVLLATNGYTTKSLGRTSRYVLPVPSFIVATRGLDEDFVHALIPGRRMVVETRQRHCYYRASPDGTRIIFGGRAALFKPSDRFFERQLRMLLAGIFPQLRGVELTHRWWGKTGFTFATLPHVGQIDGIWHALGYCGNGNGMAPWLGYKAALQILGDPEGETAFANIPLPSRWYYNGYPWFMPLADIRFRLQDIMANLAR